MKLIYWSHLVVPKIVTYVDGFAFDPFAVWTVHCLKPREIRNRSEDDVLLIKRINAAKLLLLASTRIHTFFEGPYILYMTASLRFF